MTSAGFPHSDIPGSKLACSSPRLIAACHVLHRRHVPRHPPCALYYLTRILTASFRASLRWTSDSSRCGVHEHSSLDSPRPPWDARKYLSGTRWVFGHLAVLSTSPVVERVVHLSPLSGLLTIKAVTAIRCGTPSRTKLSSERLPKALTSSLDLCFQTA
jgi:hypothetical protein